MFVKLNQKQIEDKIRFVKEYVKAENAASGSAVDANANVTSKNSCTLAGEIHKDFNIQLKRAFVCEEITKLYGKELADEYLRQLDQHEIYAHDESSVFNVYCCSASLYPFLLSGMEGLGGESKAPKHLSSFSGNYVNLCFALSSQLAGAIGAPETLFYFDYFARKDYGEDYADWLLNPNATDEQKKKAKEIENHLQSIVYAINQPAAARGYQSIFCNWAVFDKEYFHAIFKDFVFPDFSSPNWKSLEKFQRFFLKWFNKERTKALLTFPVVTASILTENGKPKDEEFARFLANEFSEGNSFFLFMDDNPQAISSCCRLKNEVTDTTFSTSSGAGGVSTGSINVITININRLVQNATKNCSGSLDDKLALIKTALQEQTIKIHKYQKAFKTYLCFLKEHNMLPLYNAGFVEMKKQFMTVGINGVLEGAEALDLVPNYNEDYVKYIKVIGETIETLNKAARTEEDMFNLEMVPAENLGVKFAAWDKKDGYKVNRNCYNSYLYKVEDDEISIIDKMRLYGHDISKYYSGGSALHLNLVEYPNAEGYYKLMCMAAKLGVTYWTTNISVTCCEEEGCKYIGKETRNTCLKCGSENVSHATRIIGYLKKTTSFSSERKKEQALRYYHKEYKQL